MKDLNAQLTKLRDNYRRAKLIGAVGWMKQLERDAIRVKEEIKLEAEVNAASTLFKLEGGDVQ
jgi:hypothetical protein